MRLGVWRRCGLGDSWICRCLVSSISVYIIAEMSQNVVRVKMYECESYC